MKAQEWGLRCLHEKKMHKRSCFVTLTYEDNYLPEGNTLMKRDLQLFFKRLRSHLIRKRQQPGGFRYFGAGEYGEHGGRPHYHVLLFGVDFPDMRPLGRSKRGDVVYQSAELRELWFQGFNTIGQITYESAVYTAKYALKKVNGKDADQHYEMLTADGVVYTREPEFALMSRRPGVGGPYYEKYGSEVLNLDSVIVDGRQVAPPRFYDTRSEKASVKHDPEAMVCKCVYCRNKQRRKRSAVLNRGDNTPERLAVKERIAIIAAEKKETKL